MTKNPDLLETIEPAIRTGLIVVGIFFGVFGLWAALAPIQSAAVAPGIVSVEGSRKTVQHLEGGIVESILVKEGDTVEKGSSLILLEQVQARSNLSYLNTRRLSALAMEARLIAERDEKDQIEFSPELAESLKKNELTEIINRQIDIFKSRKLSHEGQISIIGQGINQIEQEIIGLEARVAAATEQLNFVEDEMQSHQKLLAQGMVGKARLLELQKEYAEFGGRRSQMISEIARNKQTISEAELRELDLKTAYKNEANERLVEVKSNIYDLSDKIKAAQDVLDRTVVKAPLSGRVVALNVHTIGGVIGPAEPLLDIVPQGESLLIEAMVNPDDIDVVIEGLQAKVRLTAYNQRSLSPLNGVVKHVSADRLIDNQTGKAYFRADVEITDSLARIHDADLILYPGMQAEVMIVTGERTVLEYLFVPFTQSLNRAFREG